MDATWNQPSWRELCGFSQADGNYIESAELMATETTVGRISQADEIFLEWLALWRLHRISQAAGSYQINPADWRCFESARWKQWGNNQAAGSYIERAGLTASGSLVLPGCMLSSLVCLGYQGPCSCRISKMSQFKAITNVTVFVKSKESMILICCAFAKYLVLQQLDAVTAD